MFGTWTTCRRLASGQQGEESEDLLSFELADVVTGDPGRLISKSFSYAFVLDTMRKAFKCGVYSL